MLLLKVVAVKFDGPAVLEEDGEYTFPSQAPRVKAEVVAETTQISVSCGVPIQLDTNHFG